MRTTRIAAVLAAAATLTGAASAQVSDDVVKLGVTNDQASIYSAAGGFGAVVATRMAVEDFGGTVLGKKIEVVFADNQNKPDIGVSIVRRWLDTENVDVIVDGGSSAVGMAVQAVTREKNKLFLISGSGTHALTNQNCSADRLPVVVGHLRGRGRHRDRTDEAEARHLVLHHGGLHLRASARGAGERGGAEAWRQGARLGAGAVQHVGLLLLPAAGADLRRQGDRACHRRRRHHQRAEAGARIRPRPEGAEGRRAVHEHHRRGRARPRSRAGADHHHVVLLGPHRGEPRVLEALLREAQEDADLPHRRRLQRGDALPEGREGQPAPTTPTRSRRRCARRRSTIR